jgi:hypothetical protein
MAEEDAPRVSKADRLLSEIENVRMELKIGMGGVPPRVEDVLRRMIEILRPAQPPQGG